MKMEKLPWDVVGNEVVVGVCWGVRGRKRRTRKKRAFGEVDTVLFQGHSPGGATVLLCLICYVVHMAAARGISIRLSCGVVWECEGKRKEYSAGSLN